MCFCFRFAREAQIRHQNKFLMDGWLLASPYGSYGNLAVPYREASGSYGRRDVNLRPSTVTARRAALVPDTSLYYPAHHDMDFEFKSEQILIPFTFKGPSPDFFLRFPIFILLLVILRLWTRFQSTLSLLLAGYWKNIASKSCSESNVCNFPTHPWFRASPKIPQ
jgi:hypothetical protein